MHLHVPFVLLSSLLALCPLLVDAQTAAAEAFTPKFSRCPAGTKLVRSTGITKQSLSTSEAEYISAKKQSVLPKAWASYLKTVQASAARNHVQLPSYVSTLLSNPNLNPNLGIATSGGGYRAAIFGAGVLTTIDSRNQTSVEAGLGGLLQASSYLAGLSGGSWLVTSLIQANFPQLPELIFGSSSLPNFGGWLAQFDLTAPFTNTTAEEEFLVELIEETVGKLQAGFPVTIADVWARTLSRHFVDGTTTATFFDPNITHGAGELFSGLTSLSTFADFSQPFPIITGDSIINNPNNSEIFNEEGIPLPLTNPIYEINPFEFGSFDPILASFTPTKFLGSTNNSICVTGFDQVSYIESISSELFNEFNTSAAALLSSTIGPLFELLNLTLPEPGIELDAALVPNPFFGVLPGTFPDSNQKFLRLVDGGEDGEVTPFQPLLVKARNIDTIFAIDAPADLPDNFAAGFSVLASAQRAALFPASYSFPPIPASEDLFLSLNITKQPTFFGCNSSTTAPLIIYLANGGPPLGQPALTNTSTGQSTYQPAEIQAMLNQVFDVATQGIPVNGAKDPEWPVCLACGVVERARARSGLKREGACESCLARYCFS